MLAGHSGYWTAKIPKSPAGWFDSRNMNTNNELIAVIESARASGNPVKQVRRQKFAPSQFYLSTVAGKQLGPVTCSGDPEELNRKYEAAVAHLGSAKTRLAA